MAMIRTGRMRTVSLLAVGTAFLLGGCQKNVPQMVPVRGKVTLEGGAWPKSGTIIFSPVNSAPGLPSKPGIASFGRDGAFTAKTGEYEGLIPGEYRIGVTCWEKVPHGAKDGKSYLADQFTSPWQSGLTLKIEPGQSGPVLWEQDFPRARPETRAK
jgi:hypothetical protein